MIIGFDTLLAQKTDVLKFLDLLKENGFSMDFDEEAYVNGVQLEQWILVDFEKKKVDFWHTVIGMANICIINPHTLLLEENWQAQQKIK